MARAWPESRGSGKGRRWRVRYRLGGRGSRKRYGGSFRTKREAQARCDWINNELAAMHVPDLGLLGRADAAATRAPTLEEAAERWKASRLDVEESTRTLHRVALDRVLPILGPRPVDEITVDDVQALIVTLHEAGYERETIRKRRIYGAATLDHAGIDPNPFRDRRVKLPPVEHEELNPPPASHVEAVFHLLAPQHRLPLLFLDWSGNRVTASVDSPLVGDYDSKRRRVRLRAATTKTRQAHWVTLHSAPGAMPDTNGQVLADAIEATLGSPGRSVGGLALVGERDPEARLFAQSGSAALRTAIAKACRAAGIPLFSPHDLKHRRISLLHAQGVPWAQIAQWVGSRDLAVLANTYTHVMVDEGELDYTALLAPHGLLVGKGGTRGAPCVHT